MLLLTFCNGNIIVIIFDNIDQATNAACISALTGTQFDVVMHLHLYQHEI